MFEKFTEKAINAITEAQEQAKLMHNAYVQPEHLLLAIAKQAKGISMKLFKTYNVTFDALKKEVENRLRFEKADKETPTVPFSNEFKILLKDALDLANKSGNNYVLFEHLFITSFDDSSYNVRILEQFKFDIDKSKEILSKLVQKKSKKLSHPEIEDSKESEPNDAKSASIFEDESASKILNKALTKLPGSKYEMLGTEQIIASILEDESSELPNILKEHGLNKDSFNEKLAEQSSRKEEFESQKIILTPSASTIMNSALQIAKEFGSPQIKPEHIILGMLKSKKGLAYKILKDMHINDVELANLIIQPIEKEMPQALTILKLAKQETRRLGRNIVGTEMILLGILNEGTGVGFKVLNDLGINIKDVRQIVETLIGYGNEYYDKEIVFTKRAKKVLETAWEKANKYNRPRILSEHLLYAIAAEPKSIAMKALEQLGVDAIEVKQGILKEIEG